MIRLHSHRYVWGLFILGAFFMLSGCNQRVEIETGYGTVSGVREAKATRFLGIPFAAAPVGDLRWADPLPPEPWEGVLDASRFGSACTQFASGLPIFNQSEDCLTLNIWVPNTPGPHPVMFWVHGGGQITGSSSELQYDAAKLAASQNMIVVTTNYRLQALGFFALPGTGSRDAITGNQTIKDLIAGLEWVNQEIAGFGGDPDNITIAGESAGSTNVCGLLATPKTSEPVKLFHRAIMQSGACDSLGIMTLEEAQAEGMRLLALLGCDQDPEPLQCAREKSIRDIQTHTKMNMWESFTYRRDEWFFLLGLIIDGDIFPDNPLTLLEENPKPDTPVMLGTNKDEGSLFSGFLDHPGNAADYLTFLNDRYPDQADEYADLYPFEDFSNAGNAHSALRGDLLFKCPTLNMARLYSVHNNVWHYYFTHDVISPYMSVIASTFGDNPPELGAFHAADIGFLFDFPILSWTYRRSDQSVKHFIQNAWGNFVHTGNPNSQDLAYWELFDSNRENYLELTAQPVNRNDFRDGICSRFPADSI